MGKKRYFVWAQFILCMWACVHHVILNLNLNWIWIIYQSAYKACYHKLQSLRINNLVLVLCGTVKLQPCWHAACYEKQFCNSSDGYASEVSTLNYHTDICFGWRLCTGLTLMITYILACGVGLQQAKATLFFCLHTLAPVQIAFTDQHNTVFN